MAEQPAAGNLMILIGLSDVVIGVVLAGLGLAQDNTGLLVVGCVLAVAGLGVATLFALRKDRPVQL